MDNGLRSIVLTWFVWTSQWTHWVRVTHICVGNLTIIGWDNGLSPGRRQTIISTNDGKLLIGPLGTNFSEIGIGIQTFSFKKMHLKILSAKWRPFCLGLNELSPDFSERDPWWGILFHPMYSQPGWLACPFYSSRQPSSDFISPTSNIKIENLDVST